MMDQVTVTDYGGFRMPEDDNWLELAPHAPHQHTVQYTVRYGSDSTHNPCLKSKVNIIANQSDGASRLELCQVSKPWNWVLLRQQLEETVGW